MAENSGDRALQHNRRKSKKENREQCTEQVKSRPPPSQGQQEPEPPPAVVRSGSSVRQWRPVRGGRLGHRDGAVVAFEAISDRRVRTDSCGVRLRRIAGHSVAVGGGNVSGISELTRLVFQRRCSVVFQ